MKYMRFRVLVVDDLAASYLKATNFIKKERFDCLFIDLPTSVEVALQSISYGAPWRRELMELRRRGFLQSPHDSQRIKAIEPLLSNLEGILISIFCYRDPFDEDLLRKLSGDTFALTASSKIFGIKVANGFL
jgi:hypothetical protein